MHKAVSWLLFISAAVAIPLSGVYLSGIFNPVNSSLPDSISDLKKDSSGGCIKNIFEKVNWKSPSHIADSKALTSSTFPSSPNSRSCLTINWHRDDYPSKTWKGVFRWLWTFSTGSRGFILYVSASTDKSSPTKHLNLSSFFYILSKEKNTWKITHKKEIPAGKQILTGSFDNYFPEASQHMQKDLPFDDTWKKYWGFMSGKIDVTEICNDSKCSKPDKTKRFRGTWLWESAKDAENQQKVGDWIENLGTLTNGLFGRQEDMNLESALSSFSGKWINNLLKVD